MISTCPAAEVVRSCARKIRLVRWKIVSFLMLNEEFCFLEVRCCLSNQAHAPDYDWSGFDSPIRYYGGLCCHIMKDTSPFSFPSFIPSYHYFKHLHIPLALNVDCHAWSPFGNVAISRYHVNGLGSLHSCFPLSLLDLKKVGIHFNSCFTNYMLNDESLFCWCFPFHCAAVYGS